ncbi:uncharacterized protein LOC144863257 [Branchiostoma floridae x Branchiostoma japonicum]
MATHQKHQYPDHAQNVLRRLNQQRRAGHRFCDIAIQVQDHVFWAHKCILCGSSGYFASVLSNSTADKVELPGLTPQGVAVVLDFVYTSELHLTIENALETNNAANFLQVMDILNNCSTFLAAALRTPTEPSGVRNVHSTSSDVGNRQSSSVSSPLESVSPSSCSQDDSRCKLGYPVLSTMLQECAAKAATSSNLNIVGVSENQQSAQTESRPTSGQSVAKNTPGMQTRFSPEPSRQAVIHGTSEWSPGSNDNREMTFNPNRLSQRDRDGARPAVVVKIENEDNEVTSCSQENETVFASMFTSRGRQNSEEGNQQSSLRTKRFKMSSGSPSARLSFGMEGNHGNHDRHGNRLTPQEDTMGSLVLSCTSDSTAILDEVEGQGSDGNSQPDVKDQVQHEGSASHNNLFNQHALLQSTVGPSADQTDVMPGTVVLCDECGALFSSQSALQQHRLSIHNCLQPFKCHICPAAFRRSYELDRHLVSHSQNFAAAQGLSATPPAMVIAGTSFSEQREIADKPYRCEMCQISFKTKSNLSQHNLFRHTEERPFKCELCQAGFKRNFELNRHMNTHNRRRDMDGTI